MPDSTKERAAAGATLPRVEPNVRTFRLKDPPGSPSAPAATPERAFPRWLGALLPLVLLTAVIGGVVLVKLGPVHLFAGLVALGVVLGFGWILASAVLPAAPVDRTCPACGVVDGLRPAHEDTTRGVACRACGFRDEDASAWMIAEEDGPLESVVLRERAARRGRSASPAPNDPR